VHYSSFFQYIYLFSIYYGPYSSCVCTCFLTYFGNDYCNWWTHAYYKTKKWHHVPQLYQLSSEKWSTQDALLSAMLNLLYSNMNQQLFEKNLCNHSSHYGQFPLRMEAYYKINTLPTWDTKEGTFLKSVATFWKCFELIWKLSFT